MSERTVSEWSNLRYELIIEMKKFEEEYREKNKNHECSGKFYDSAGNWYCNHLEKARTSEFKNKMKEEVKSFVQSRIKV